MQKLSDVIYTKHHQSSAFALVRSRARTSMKKYKTICQKCGYDKHTEVCHIKPISDFTTDTTVSEVNGEENLVLLCPNCHWEFDKLNDGDVSFLDDITPRQLKVHKPRKRQPLRNKMSAEELHKLVWSQPATRVAEQLEMSSRGVKRLCETRNVETPPRGFWRRLETGGCVSCPII